MFTVYCRPGRHKEESDVEIDEVVFALEEDNAQDKDETDTEDLGTGIAKITSPDNIPILTDDQLYLIYLQPLLDLASTKLTLSVRWTHVQKQLHQRQTT